MMGSMCCFHCRVVLGWMRFSTGDGFAGDIVRFKPSPTLVWDGWGDVERTYKKNLVTRAVLHIHPALCGDFFVLWRENNPIPPWEHRRLLGESYQGDAF